MAVAPTFTPSPNAVAAALAVAAVGAQSQPPVSFWPLPVGLNFGAGAAYVDRALRVTVHPPTPAVSEYAAWLMERYVFAQQPGGPAPAGSIGLVTINIANPTAPLEIAMDESYTLSVPASGAVNINANTTSGAYWALQTLSQAIRFDFESQQYAVQGVPLAITDAPKFGYRALMIDTDRHWLSLHHLLRIVDSMAFAKVSAARGGDWVAGRRCLLLSLQQ
jgi:hexosaminidase